MYDDVTMIVTYVCTCMMMSLPYLSLHGSAGLVVGRTSQPGWSLECDPQCREYN